MMSKRQWFALLCVFMCYLLFGASVFYTIESREEVRRLLEEKHEREVIEELLEDHYIPSEGHTKHEIFFKISSYCDKPLGEHVPNKKSNLTWTFYHAIFFVMTIVSTIGYGNLSPTTPFTRTFMIIYGLVGIPINGMVVITLGDFFGKSFLNLYNRWKSSRVQRALTTCGFIGQIFLYLIPGITLFIFLPSLIILLYEEWTYDIAIEFTFATLTTIGVGQHVPGTNQNDRGTMLFAIYRTFLLIWIIMGLGYLAMVFGFISRGLQSKKMHALEQKIAHNIKKTNKKVRQELRSILNEYLLMRVKRVYRERRTCISTNLQRTQSCPDLRLDREIETPKMRRRAYSELTKPSPKVLTRMQSDSDLDRIDKERTFLSEAEANESNKFLLRVAHALGNYGKMDCSANSASEEISDNSENENSYDSQWPFGKRKLSKKMLDPMRPRAASESKKERAAVNCNLPRFKGLEARRIHEIRELEKYGKARSRTLPPITKPQSFFARLKNSLKHQEIENPKTMDIENQNYVDSNQRNLESAFRIMNKDQLLEETSLADFLRALSAFSVPEASTPRRKLGSIVAPRIRRLPIVPLTPSQQTRRISLIPESPSQETTRRRFSLSPTIADVRDTEDIRYLGFTSVNERNAARTLNAGSQNRKFSSKQGDSNTVRRRISVENLSSKIIYQKENCRRK